MKTKLARVFYWLAEWLTQLADWLSGVKTVTFKPTRATLAVAVDCSSAPPIGAVVSVDGTEYFCTGNKPNKSGLGFDLSLARTYAVDVFAGEQFKTKPEEKGEE